MGYDLSQQALALARELGDRAAEARVLWNLLNYYQATREMTQARALGDRLNHDVGLDAYRAASTLLLLSPYTPLLFMGQEWAASTPFQFFTDHGAELGRLVTEGRRAEFAGFSAFSGE